MDKSKLKRLFADMCCSECKSDFDEESIKIIRQDEGLYVVKIECPCCHKSFGLAFLGIESISLKPDEIEDEFVPLQIQDGPEPINEDDVINAHNFIKALESDWRKHIPKDFIE